MLEYMTQCRRDLHRIPELEQHLPETCAYVKAQLAALSCTVLEPTEGSVCAYFDEGKAETAAFRADMDALPVTEETGLPFASRHPGGCTPAATTATPPCCWALPGGWRRGGAAWGATCC